MGPRIWSIEQMRSQRRQQEIKEELEYRLGGEIKTVMKNVANGEMEVPLLSKPLGELITTDPGMEELMEKVVLDVELGREEVPTVYEPIYDRIEDANFPRTLDANWVLEGRVVFLERLEGGEVVLGTVAAEEGPIARIVQYAAGFEYTEEMIEYDHTFEMETLNRSFGEAYNALLNHIHLSPIITFNYQSDNQTANQGDSDDPYVLQVKKTIRQGINDCVMANRPASILLASKAKQGDIEDSLERMLIDGTEYPSVGGIDDIIYYDGWQTKVGKKTYTYDGVDENTAYLIRGQRGLKELIKRDLLIDAQPGPITRLIEEQVVGRAYRGVFAAVEENVQELDLTEVTE